MHLKESNVTQGDTCLLNPSDSATGPKATQQLPNNNTNNNNTNAPAEDNKREQEVTAAALVTANKNNNNTAKSFNIPSSKTSQSHLIINTGSAANGGVLVDLNHGMTTSLSFSSLPDLSENGSCSSDRLHHPSISSGVHRPTRLPVSSSLGSLSSIDNDESDLESFSSLEVDVTRGPDTPDPRAVKDRNLLDFEALGSLWQRPNWKTADCDPLLRPTNDLSPHAHGLCTNNVNELSECGAFVKSFYDKPKLRLESEAVLANDPGDDNGNLRWCAASSGNSPVQELCDSLAASPDYASEDENPSDIEQKMAETKVKMNDAILSNGKEELQLHGKKLKHYIKHRELRESCGAASSVVLANNNNNNNNNSLKQQPGTLKLSDTGVDDDNRYRAVLESPIVDAYEKECLDVPEKMVRELETHTKEGGSADDFIPCKKEKMEINELHKKCRSVEGAADGAANPQPQPTPSHCPIRRVDAGANKENSAPNVTDVDKPRGPRVSYCGVEAAALRRDSPQRRRDRVAHRRSVPQASPSPAARERAKLGSPDGGEFDVYTMEAAMPKIDWDTIEAHLRATKEEERRRRNDREEIRRKLAMGLDEDQTTDRPHRKPSLHSRLQSGMNLQICFMNETASDCESQCSDTESTQDREVDSEQVSTTSANSKCSTPHSGRNSSSQSEADLREENFFARQAQLQQEARLALAQAKEMARMQMEIEKQSRKKSPIAEVVRASFNKIGVPFPDSKRRISRQILTDMNVAQLQVIVNDLHTQIESLNEDLVTFLMERDDLHMEQDSMLVDIEDLTKHIGAKELSLRGDSKDGSIKSLSVLTPPTKTKTNSMRLKGSSKK
ncbi:schwannomin-interacting protein 1-like isoform X1 [Scylla paramamosain]|uniref:schwannomin-interacting protein 1-like isoform X1 n=1 Tax=Scylla paramamosain TaxID=85552 RepID=UPI003083EAC2